MKLSDRVKHTQDTDEELDPQGIRVFVYGTLKSGHCNNDALADAEFLGRCYIEGNYRLVDLGWYPAILDAPDDRVSRIFGEVYLISEDELLTLDCIEGHPEYYKRRKVPTPWKNAWCYFLPEDYNDRKVEDVENGIWEPSDEELEFARGAA